MLRRLMYGAMLTSISLSTGCFSLTKSGPLPGIASTDEASAPEKLELPPQEGARACFATAEMLEKTGKSPEAVAMYDRARTLDPSLNATAARRMAVIYDGVGAFSKSDDEYRIALAAMPNDADLWNDFGYSHYSRGNWTTAEEAFRRSLQNNDQLKRAWVNLGLTLAQLDQPEESLQAFAHAVPKEQAHCNLAFVLAARGKTPAAIREYKKALEIAPDLQLARAAVAKLSVSPGTVDGKKKID